MWGMTPSCYYGCAPLDRARFIKTLIEFGVEEQGWLSYRLNLYLKIPLGLI